jgi:hypothetical protein
MSLKLQDLRKYAIDNRVEIALNDSSSGHRCAVNILGQVRILDDDKDLRFDDVFAAADSFEMTVAGKPRRFTRDEMAQTIADAFKQRGFAAAAKEDD